MSKFPLASPITEAETSQKATSSYLQNTLLQISTLDQLVAHPVGSGN